MRYSFNGFTERANLVLNIAIDIAGRLGHTYVGSEHILLGLLKEESSAAANILASGGVSQAELEELLLGQVIDLIDYFVHL